MSAPPSPAPALPAGVRLGRVLGVPVLVSPTWLLFGAFVLVSYGPALAERVGPVRGYVAAGSYAVLLLASVLLHEVGHCAVARTLGLPVRSITVTFLAGMTDIAEPPQTPAQEYAVAVVGPMVSLLLAGLGAGLLPLFQTDSLPYLLALGTAATNGVVAAFNLLPGLPLDGGRVLRAVLWRLTGDSQRATVLAASAGRVVALVAVPALVLGVLPALGLGAPSIGTAVLAALVATFVFGGATAALRQARLVQRLPAGTVRRLARPALCVPGDLPLAEAVRRVQEARLHAVVVVDRAGRPVALGDEAAVLSVPESRRPWVPMSSVARTLEPGLVLSPDLAGEQLLATLRATPSTGYLVELESGPAVLTAADVVREAGDQARRR
jgi:Zn-dependent protease